MGERTEGGAVTDRHSFQAQPGCNICVCGEPRSAHGPTEEQIAAIGRLFARTMDKRDGLATQEQVDVEVDKVIAAFDLVAPSDTTETEP